jgi:GNAT superfamily N-acetyltransferase
MKTAMQAPILAEQLMIVPANEASWDDLAAIFGTTDYPGRCQCQRFKVVGWIWRDSTQEERTAMFRAQTSCGVPNVVATSGLVAYVDDEPAGWVAVEPRTAYPKLRTSRVPWSGRHEDKGDDSVWAVTCFAVRKGYRGRGLTYPLAQAAIGFARERGARALEAYPMITQPGKEITWGEMHVGARQVFLDAGFVEVSRPTARRVVMRIDFVHVADPLTAPRCHQGVSDRENPGRHINGARRRTGRLRSNRPAPWSTHPG